MIDRQKFFIGLDYLYRVTKYRYVIHDGNQGIYFARYPMGEAGMEIPDKQIHVKAEFDWVDSIGKIEAIFEEV